MEKNDQWMEINSSSMENNIPWLKIIHPYEYGNKKAITDNWLKSNYRIEINNRCMENNSPGLEINNGIYVWKLTTYRIWYKLTTHV